MLQTRVVWKKSLGQHLLHDKNILRKIVEAIAPKPGECIVEIGGGTGVLTELLAAEPTDVIVVELDTQFVSILAEKFENQSNVTILPGDILKLRLNDILPSEVKAVVAGNLPYNITSPILFHLFEQRDVVSRMVFMVQREVARRMTAPPGIKDRSILSILCQFHSDVQVLFPVSRSCFFPVPKVDSAVVELKIKEIPAGISPEKFIKTAKAAFNKRRKMLKNSLKDIAGGNVSRLEGLFDVKRRPEELTIDEFIFITQQLSPNKSNNQ